MGSKVGLDGENSRPTRIRSSDRPTCSSAAIPTELPGPHKILLIIGNTMEMPQLKFSFTLYGLFLRNVLIFGIGYSPISGN